MTFIESETTGLKSSVVADLLLYNTKTRKTISVDAEPYRKHPTSQHKHTRILV